MKYIMTILAALVTATVADAAPILWDIGTTRAGNTNAVVADFAAAGLWGDLSGATVSQVIGTTASNSTMTAANGVTLTYVGELWATGTYVANTDVVNPLIADYIFIKGGNHREMQIGGLSAQLDAETDYYLHIWGIGDSPGQSSKFVFNGETITLDNTLDPTVASPDNFVARYTFTTDAVVSDTLDFEWHRQGTYGGLNGFAIVAVPEPATLGLFGLVGLGAMAARRFRIK